MIPWTLDGFKLPTCSWEPTFYPGHGGHLSQCSRWGLFKSRGLLSSRVYRKFKTEGDMVSPWEFLWELAGSKAVWCVVISLASHGLCYGKLGICLETMGRGKGLGSLGKLIKKFKFNLEMEFFLLLFHLGFCIGRQPSSCATMKVLSDENTYSFTTSDQNNRPNSPKDPCIHFAFKIHPIPTTGIYYTCTLAIQFLSIPTLQHKPTNLFTFIFFSFDENMVSFLCFLVFIYVFFVQI